MPFSDRNTAPSESSSAPCYEVLIRNVSDTARLVALDRAVESERPDALFRDPFARRLAGERGARIAKSNPLGGRKGGIGWPIVTRTYVIDKMIQAHIAQGGDAVINLAAGLDTRPYRMDLPSSLQWIEVDLPEILAHKEEILRGEKPVCSLERIRLDLSDLPARRELFAASGRRAATRWSLPKAWSFILPPTKWPASRRTSPPSPVFVTGFWIWYRQNCWPRCKNA